MAGRSMAGRGEAGQGSAMARSLSGEHAIPYDLLCHYLALAAQRHADDARVATPRARAASAPGRR